MKVALVFAALLGVLGFTYADASAASLECHGTLTQAGHVCIVGNTLIGSPNGWHWIRDVATKKTYLFPDGDDTDAFISGFYRNQNSALVVAMDPGSTVGFTMGFPYNGTGAEAQKNASASAVVTGDSGGTTTFSPLTNDGSSAKNLNVNLNAQGLTALNARISSAASGGWKYTLLDFHTAGTAQNVKTGAGTLEAVQWVCSTAMTSTTTLEVWDNTTNSGNRVAFATFLSGGSDSFGTQGLAMTTGIEVDMSAAQGPSGCDVLVLWQ